MPVLLDEENLVQYTMLFFNSETRESKTLLINQFLGKKIRFTFSGNIFCKSCGVKTKTSFNQGFCYNCFKTAPESSECIIRPELCEAHLEKEDAPRCEGLNHDAPHFVYLAGTDIIKVGVTRSSQIPTRWIDQGASSAIKFAETPNRYLAGEIEVALKSSFSDKTNWRKMLQNNIDESLDLEETKWQLEELLPDDISQYVTEDDDLTEINYPVLEFPTKVSTINLDKTSSFEAKLMGIKGQYFLLDNNRVINIRKYIGYQVGMEFDI